MALNMTGFERNARSFRCGLTRFAPVLLGWSFLLTATLFAVGHKGQQTPALLRELTTAHEAHNMRSEEAARAYRGHSRAEHWSELDPDYAPCNVGNAQSPIDIQKAEKAELPALRFESKGAPFRYLVNNGHTIRVNYHDAAGTGNLLIVGDKTYQLTQFHFHHPSEEYIHGKPY